MDIGKFLEGLKTPNETLKDFSDTGFSLLFIFLNKITCNFTKTCLSDLIQQYDSILKTHTIPVLVYIDKKKDFETFFNSKGYNKYTKLFTFPDEKIRETLDVNYQPNHEKMEKKGILEENYLEEEFGLVLIHSGKVMKKFTTFLEHEKPNFLRFVMETELEVTKRPRKSFKKSEISIQKRSIFEAPSSPISLNTEKKKEKKPLINWPSSPFESVDFSSTEEFEANLENILNTKEWRHFFKLYLAQEYAMENISFLEKVEEFKSNTKKRGILLNEILEAHFTQDSIHEINAPAKLVEALNKAVGSIKCNEIPEDLFDKIVNHLKAGPLLDSYSRFILSDLYFEMKNCKVTKNFKTKVIKSK